MKFQNGDNDDKLSFIKLFFIGGLFLIVLCIFLNIIFRNYILKTFNIENTKDNTIEITYDDKKLYIPLSVYEINSIKNNKIDFIVDSKNKKIIENGFNSLNKLTYVNVSVGIWLFFSIYFGFVYYKIKTELK